MQRCGRGERGREEERGKPDRRRTEEERSGKVERVGGALGKVRMNRRHTVRENDCSLKTARFDSV